MLVTMTDRELYRLGIIQRVFDRALLQRDAADILELSVRQVQRLVRLYRTDGATAFASSRRGRPANNRIDEEIHCKALDLIRCHYSDFGPTLATEKLAERHRIHLSVETVSNWMTADGLWRPHSRRRTRVYQPRDRRDCLGELVQIDGSHHDWFEGRAPKCCLLVFMDDATGRLMHLRFCDSENAFDYMMATRQYIDKHGKPVAFYSDKHAVFRVSGPESQRTGTTQFGRALRELAIELICANSSQAKGRVERVNKTLQDRLIKEMRLQNISSVTEANQWIEHFMSDFNRRFSRPAKYPKDHKASVFRINNRQATGGDGQTQFGRAMNELNITGICANISSAKGRVERAHLTLQDRLVKELRLRGISTPEAANAFADEFMADYNRRFSKPPRHDFDVHRPLENNENLEATFTWREQRKVSKNLTLQYDKKLYLLEDNEENRRFQGKYIDVWQYPDGTIELRANGTSLPFITYDRLGELDQGAIVDNKRLGRALEMIKLVQDKRDNTRSQALPSLDGQTSRRKKQPEKKSQRSLNQDDMLEALQQLQTRSQEIFGKS